MKMQETMKAMTLVAVALAGGMLMAVGGPADDEGTGDGPRDRGNREAPGIRAPTVQRMHAPMNMGNWVGKFICQSNTLDRLGVTNAAARAKIVKDLTDIDEQMQALTKKIRAASIAQAKLVPDVLEKPGTDTKEFFAKIDEIGVMRTAQAKLATQVLIVLRDQLTDEQRDDVREMMETEGHKRFRARQQFNEEMDKRQPQLDRHDGDGMRAPRGSRNNGSRKAPGATKPDDKDDAGADGMQPPPPPPDGDEK